MLERYQDESGCLELGDGEAGDEDEAVYRVLMLVFVRRGHVHKLVIVEVKRGKRLQGTSVFEALKKNGKENGYRS
jgi:hypothetical protein